MFKYGKFFPISDITFSPSVIVLFSTLCIACLQAYMPHTYYVHTTRYIQTSLVFPGHGNPRFLVGECMWLLSVYCLFISVTISCWVYIPHFMCRSYFNWFLAFYADG